MNLLNYTTQALWLKQSLRRTGFIFFLYVFELLYSNYAVKNILRLKLYW